MWKSACMSLHFASVCASSAMPPKGLKIKAVNIVIFAIRFVLPCAPITLQKHWQNRNESMRRRVGGGDAEQRIKNAFYGILRAITLNFDELKVLLISLSASVSERVKYIIKLK